MILAEREASDSLSLTAKRAYQPKAATALLPPDGIGDLKPGGNQTLLVITSDTVGDGIGVAPGNPVITVGTPAAPVAHTIGTLDIPGDQDYFQVTLEAGQTYQIGMYGYAGGPSLVPLSDPYIEILTANGTTEGYEVVSADGGALTIPNNVNSGLDVLLTFEPTVSGTYYINARAFGNAGGPNGDEVGDYELFVNNVTNDPTIYRPYYSPDSPLYSIDWGTQVNRVNETVRNPDGDEGPRETGNPQGTFPIDNPNLVDGKNVITIYFAREGDVFASEDPLNPGLPPAVVSVGTQDWEKATVFTALGEFSKVADVVYVEVDTREEADFIFVTYSGTPGPGISLLGSMGPPDYYDEGLAQFNSGDYRWTEENLQQGGFSYVTLIHEFGHGHGLAHPHDNGGHSGEMRGVEGVIDGPAGEVPDPTGVWPNYTLGDFNLNQAVYTMMSYMDGWQDSPYGNAPTDAGYGYLGGLMAFDIAVIQDKYGVNEDWATGNDVYIIKDVNAAGTFYSSIWDAAGTDSIVYYGTRDTTIDLRAATLQYEEGGGGWVSYADGIFGGFTIANGVTIENATSGDGDDTLIGNSVGNLLDGRGGGDEMSGGGGDDYYFVDNAGDQAIETAGQGYDTVFASVSFTLGADVDRLVAYDPASTTALSFTGNALANEISGNAGANLIDGRAGADLMVGGGGDDIYFVDNVGDVVSDAPGAGYDTVFSSISFTLESQIERVVAADTTSTAVLHFTGNASANEITGNAGGNLIDGRGGSDLLFGGGGADAFVFSSALGGDFDALPDFVPGTDRVYLDDAIFADLTPGALAAGAFRTGAAAADADDRIIYDPNTGALYFDADGNGAGLAVQFAMLHEGLLVTASDFQVI